MADRSKPFLKALEEEFKDIIKSDPQEEPESEPELEPEVPDLGRLSAEAVLAQYEQTAKSVELLGDAAKEWITKLEDIFKELDENLKLIASAAEKVRKKGDSIHSQIAEASALSKIIRDTCDDFSKKVS